LKAIVHAKYGSPDLLRFEEVDRPVPTDDQVLVKVVAASVNPVDWHIMRGKPFIFRLMGFGLFGPKQHILGADVSGRIEAVGKSVTQFKVGDNVFGRAVGGFAEYACCLQDHVALKPEGVTFEKAASAPVAGITALQGIRDHGRMQAGQEVLITGASGGVGSFAVQIAKALGATVTGVCGGGNVELARSLGADHVIDYTKEAFYQSDKRYDLILDNAAFYPIKKPLRAVKPGGSYILVGGLTFNFLHVSMRSMLPAGTNKPRVGGFVARLNRVDLAFLGELMADGKVVPVIEKTYPLAETPQAIAQVETGHVRGKVITEKLRVDNKNSGPLLSSCRIIRHVKRPAGARTEGSYCIH
jgi:NADPH:quinone reductase-like Zn-dependent oxidoreductase